MDRRGFLRRGLAWAAGAVAATWFRLPPAWGGASLFEDTFKRSATSKGWGKKWFNQRYKSSWGIAKKKGFYDLPAPQAGAASFNPNPVLVLDKDVRDVDMTVKMSTNREGARFGLLARAVNYGDCYAAYLDGTDLVFARFGADTNRELKRVGFTVDANTFYWVRFKIAGTNPISLKAKVWKASKKEPSKWTGSTTDTDPTGMIPKAGPFGFVFMHDLDGQSSTLKVSNFTASSAETGKKTKPEITFAFVGVHEAAGAGIRARMVAKSDIPGSTVFHIGTDPTLQMFETVAPDENLPKLIVSKAWLDAPVPGDYYWRAEATSKAGKKTKGKIHRFTTPPAPGSSYSISFAFGSCSHYFPPGRSYQQAQTHAPLFFAHLGDFGYAQNDEGTAAMVARKDSFQDRWIRMFAGRSIGDLQMTSSWFMVQDDHDYGLNSAWSQTIFPFTIEAWDELSGNLDQRYFDVEFADIHCFFLDTHVNADDPATPDGPDHSLLGDAQKTWLKDAMQASTAPLLVVFAPMPFWGAGSGLNTWKSAFSDERVELMTFFGNRQASGRRVLICSGNAHAHFINRHPDPGGGSDIIEFVSSGTDRFGTGGGDPISGGGGIIDTTRAIKSTDAFGLVTLDTTGAPDKVVLQCFASRDGQPVWPELMLDVPP